MNVLSAITGVFDTISDWIIGAVPGVTALFWDATTGLTFMGTLAVAGLAFSVVFLLIGIVQRFLHFGG